MHKDFTDKRVSAFVCDLTVDDLRDHIPPSSVDIVTMVLDQKLLTLICSNSITYSFCLLSF